MASSPPGNPIAAMLEAAVPVSKSKKVQNQLIVEIENGATSGLLQSITAPLEAITLAHLGLDNLENCFEPGVITLINLYPHKTLWVGVFCMTRGTRFPLHDHPDMIGMTRLFHGSLYYRNLDIVSSTNGISEAKVVSQGTVSGVATFQLTPNRGNIHEIEAVEDSVLLDLFLPNYGKSRICTYFQETESRGEYVVLRPLMQPEIPCQERRYTGLPIE